jgi:hypothetical protein
MTFRYGELIIWLVVSGNGKRRLKLYDGCAGASQRFYFSTFDIRKTSFIAFLAPPSWYPLRNHSGRN